MKKLQIEIREEAHDELLKIQLDRKMKKKGRTTIKEIASDVLNDCLTKKDEKEK